MTALDKYTRLEALGQWREAPDQEPREVVVSFGDAILLLSDVKENPLCHWAMAATSRLSLDGSKAVYTPDTEGFETLEIDDAQMVEAIARVSQSVAVTKTSTPWLRWVLLAFIVTLLGAIAILTPGQLRDQAVRMTGQESARKIGVDMVATLNVEVCHEQRADVARALFQSRAFPDRDVRLMVNKDQQSGAFPGAVLLISNDTLQSMTYPAELSALANEMLGNDRTGIERLFTETSVRDLFGYITSGVLPEARLAAAAAKIVGAPNPDATATQSAQQILRDQDWVALQGICLE